MQEKMSAKQNTKGKAGNYSPYPLTCYFFFIYLHLALMTNSMEKELIYALSLLTAPWNFSH